MDRTGDQLDLFAPRTQLNLRLSKLRYVATLQDIDCSPARNLTSSQLAVLTDPAWMGRGENVLITGATGCGKSYLACALGNHACALGKRTLYVNVRLKASPPLPTPVYLAAAPLVLSF